MAIPQKTENKDRRLKNLIPYKPGQSGNPNGRPKLTPEEKAVKKATKELIKDYTDKLADALPAISPVLIAQALGGNLIAIKEINDRVLGKPKETIDLEVKPKMVQLDD